MDVLALDEYDDAEKVARLADIDPEFAEATKSQQCPQLDLRDIFILRAVSDAGERYMIERLPPLPAMLKENEVLIPTRDGYTMPAKLFYPAPHQAPRGGCPIVVMWHGGGWSSGSSLQCVPLARGLAGLLSCVVMLPDYRLSPENPFPTGVLDAWDSVRFASDANRFEVFGLSINHSKGFLIGGWSAGGNFTAVLAQKARDEGLDPPLTGQYLGFGSFMVPQNVPKAYKHLYFSYKQNADAPIHTWKDVEDFQAMAQMDLESPLWSPLLPSPDDISKHAGLPKAFVQTSGMDPMRDDSLVYARILREAGVQTLTQCFPGLPHAWQIFVPHLDVSKKAGSDVYRGFAWLLGLDKDQWEENRVDEFPVFPAPKET